jgi:hypothetical protein|tara:strand:- start:69 stop:296 length:228 start_codon:yes stop_codon:yes gene_type:complete
MDLVHIIDGLIGVVVLGFGYWASTLASEVKRIEILLNRTREDFVSRSEVKDDMRSMTESFIRLEAKLDKLISRQD